MRDPMVHVIDDDDAVRASLAFLLEMADLPACTYGSANAFLQVAATLASGCIVTDVRMPDMSGLELVRRLKHIDVKLPVIVITGHADVALAVEAMRAGVVDFLEKPFDDSLLITAIRSALDAQTNASRHSEAREQFQRHFDSLSGREREVLQGVIAGKLNKVIAYELDISPRTVEIYRANLMTKTGAGTMAGLMRIALAAGL